MPETVTNELIYEGLKQLQAGQVETKATLASHTHQFIALREQLYEWRQFSAAGEVDDRIGNACGTD